MEQTAHDRRAYPRSEWRTVLQLTQDNQVFKIQTVDRSLGGICCEYVGANNFTKNEQLTLISETDRREVRIAWVDRISPTRQRMGLEFMD